MSWHNKTILIAEDEEANYFLLQEFLEPTEVVIFWAENGLKAVELFIQHKPNVVLMDLKMPLMDGYEALAKIREADPQIPVIAQTAYTMVGDMEKILAAGFTDYISKPINEKLLLDKIGQFL